MKNDAVRRIMAEVKEFSTLNTAPSSFFCAAPLESDLFEWHFSVRGPPDTPFHLGVYHGRILLPAEYPLKPPEIILLTPNGRFEVGKRICLSVTAHHQETWQPSWGIRTILTALVGFMPSKAEGVGALDYPDDERRRLARKSWSFRCPRCGVKPVDHLPPRTTPEGGSSTPHYAANASTQQPTVETPQNGTVQRENTPSIKPSAAAPGGASSDAANIDTNKAAHEGQESHPATHTDMETGTGTSEALTRNQGAGASGDVVSTDSVRDVGAVEEDVVTPQPAQAAERSRDAGNCSTEILASPPANTAPKPTQSPPEEVQEKELLYLAYGIVVLMLLVIVRRAVEMLAP